MKKAIISLIVLIIILSVSCSAVAKDYDFENMTKAELEAVITEINDEIDNNHRTTSNEVSAIDNVVKGFVEDKYGKDNVDWAWIDYTYTKEWDYYTMKTHADIKLGGSSTRYDIYSELYKQENSPELIFIQIGSQVYIDQRNEIITDNRIRKMLALSVQEDNNGEENEETTSESSKKVLEFQPIKLWDESSETGNQELATTPTPEPTPTPIPTPTPTEAPLAKSGDCNETVREVQNMLYKLGYLSTSADGQFGDNTFGAVKKFQEENGLSVTGTVTKETYDSLSALSAKIKEPEKPIYVTAVQLYDAFRTNEISAEAMYKDKLVQVSGTVDSVEKGWFGTYYVNLRADDWGFTTVCCYFDENSVDSLANLREGQYIAVKGTCDNGLIVSVHNCILVN